MTEKATFGAGCFWHVEATFRQIKGVLSTQVGFMGGRMKNPAYEDVCTDKTGHAEVVEITYDANKVSYVQLLKVFWKNHDPTQLNMQGHDVGTQYRSVIFYQNEKQKAASIQSKEKEQKKYKNKVTTEIMPASTFYKAEDYHQQYLFKTKCSSSK